MGAKGALRAGLRQADPALLVANTLQGGNDALAPRIALVDESGKLLFRNQHWNIRRAPSSLMEERASDHDYLRRYGVTASIFDEEAHEIAEGLRAVISGSRISFLGRYRSNRNETQHYETRVTRIMNDPRRVLIMHEDVSDVMRAETEARDIAALLFAARDSERKRIARELHDTTVQDLIGAKLVLEQFDYSISTAKILGILDRSLNDLRTLSYLFHPPLLDDYGLVVALRSYVTGFGRRTGVETAFESPPHVPALSSEVQQSVYYVVQEALTNVYRHSGSKVARVKLAALGGAISVDIADGGKGIGNPRVAGNTPGVGISGMRARARLYGGTLSILSRRNGTTVHAEFPAIDDAINFKQNVSASGDGVRLTVRPPRHQTRH